MNDRILTDEERALGGLMEVAELQQRAVEAAITALKHRQAELAHAVVDLEALGKSLPGTVGQAASQGVTRALQAQMQTVTEATMQAMAIAFKPQYDRLNAATVAAETTDQVLKKTVAGIEDRLHHAEERFGWRWAWVAGALTCGAIVAVAGIAWGAVWWQRDQLADLQAQKVQLITDIVQGQAALAQLEKKTGGVSYHENSKGRFIAVPKGYDEWTCNGETPCIRLK